MSTPVQSDDGSHQTEDSHSDSELSYDNMKDKIDAQIALLFGPESRDGPIPKLKARVMLRNLQFLNDKAVQQDDLHDMLRHLNDREKPSVVSPYLDEDPDIAERKEFFTWLKTSKFVPGHNRPPELLDPTIFTPLVWSAFTIAPMEQLREFRLHETNIPAIISSLQGCLPVLMNVFLARSPGAALGNEDTPTNKRKRENDEDEAAGKSKNRRDQKNRKLAYERDKGACVLTGAPFPQVCHIIPHSARQHKNRVNQALRQLWALWGPQVDGPLKLLDDEGYDEPRNMISLNCAFHTLWGKAMVALEPVEKGKTWIIVQVRWMHNSKLGSRFDKKRQTAEHVDINLDVKDIIEPLSNEHNVPIRIVNLESQRYIKDGHKFMIVSEKSDHLPSEELLRLQYNLCRMASLTGAAEPDDDVDSDSDSDLDTELTSVVDTDVEAWDMGVEEAGVPTEGDQNQEQERTEDER
ncbi:hypothetical protein CTA1_1270 [Colletotrichum tanaceti]|uniref:HNH nuclease domain-containing protein n=1 Tax=Colletotrichum tanaceti TaxID=1306861 RepID=A0A4U6X353_9PEZI|nr:hypothetical protein CTA1_1270 [Colletotrichum tanaceti]